MSKTVKKFSWISLLLAGGLEYAKAQATLKRKQLFKCSTTDRLTFKVFFSKPNLREYR
jgi:hypothetical protein